MFTANNNKWPTIWSLYDTLLSNLDKVFVRLLSPCFIRNCMILIQFNFVSASMSSELFLTHDQIKFVSIFQHCVPLHIYVCVCVHMLLCERMWEMINGLFRFLSCWALFLFIQTNNSGFVSRNKSSINTHTHTLCSLVSCEYDGLDLRCVSVIDRQVLEWRHEILIGLN